MEQESKLLQKENAIWVLRLEVALSVKNILMIK